MKTLSEIQNSRDVQLWAEFLTHADIPVLKHTAREFARLLQDEDKISVRDIHQVVIQDPMMTFRLLRYSQQHRNKHQLQELVLVEQAVMMMGMTAFFRHLPAEPLAEDMLKTNIAALTRLLKLIHRSHRAAKYAVDWAAMLYDLKAEEVLVAALLHDLAEMLLWCFLPEKMSEITKMQAADKNLRSKAAQEQVLGFPILDLQLALVERCGLPTLLSSLMHESGLKDRRVKNVSVAVNFARHSANGWDDAALPDDYKDISELLRVDVPRVKSLVGAPN